MLFLNVFFRTLGFLTALLVFSIIFSIFFQLTNNSQKNQFIITDGDEDSKNTIAKINLNGPILNDANKFLGNNFYDYINPDLVETYLEDLKKIKTNILVVNINSPGGTVSATADLEKIFYEFKKETNTKIYFFTKEILASGGYWVATTADKIFASYGSMIGSIGVSGPSWFYYDTPISLSQGVLSETIETQKGIIVFNQNAGEGKDLFNPYRKPKKEELDHLQKIVDDIYSDFISKVSRNRKIEISFVKNNVGALIYSSNQAKEKFLIDDVLDYESFISNIIKENNFDDYKIYENKDKSTLIFDFLTNYKSPNNKYSNTKICNKLQTSINVITPFFLRDC